MVRRIATNLPKDSRITALSSLLVRDYYWHINPAHIVVVYSDSRSCLQAIEGVDTKNTLMDYIINFLWVLGNKGTRVHFCWMLSHCDIGGNERVGQVAKEELGHGLDQLASAISTQNLCHRMIIVHEMCVLNLYGTVSKMDASRYIWSTFG